MALVAVAALLMGAVDGYLRLRRRSVAFRARAEQHAAMEEMLRRLLIDVSGDRSPVDISPGPGLPSKRFTARFVADREASLKRKYERAARYPWLPVAPDPPYPGQ
jgi:hypothetical protein